MRDYRVRSAKTNKEHLTGRTCDTPGCGGKLKDTIINFGEGLDQNIISKAFEKSGEGELYICMGSSMRVSPANQLPLVTFMNGGRIVLINLQKTGFEEFCEARGMVIHEMCDKVMNMLMAKLEMPIPEFHRFYRVRLTMRADDNSRMHITGIDSNGDCYTIFKSIMLTGLNASAVKYPKTTTEKQPFDHAIQ